MSTIHSKIGANIRNYTELNKGSNRSRVGHLIRPSSNSYGLPVLELKPISKAVANTEAVTTIDRDTIGNVELRTNKHADRNFLIGTACAAAIFLVMIFSYHVFVMEQDKVVMSGETPINIDQKRLNHSPESVYVSDVYTPEYIPGVTKEEEVATCALIVGSFARQSNAIEMQQKVLSAGFELYTEEFQNFYRVGISYDCSDIKGASFLEVEKVIGVDPWLHISF
ncbi:SPOR domain-containing protein [Portibacter marinus]|uniref:SPOR domain-containing protein n=1 Tax=Portibacter marinus TaxID=2898660 RepID=UPI001F1B733F|nr:hypothetical protein [Portibacter marinus]